jgi:hypothetical protein
MRRILEDFCARDDSANHGGDNEGSRKLFTSGCSFGSAMQICRYFFAFSAACAAASRAIGTRYGLQLT